MPDSAQFIDRIKDSWTREEFPAKSLLVKEGAFAKKLFFVETGCCRCWFNTDDGKEVTMNFGFEGSFVSSMETIISDEPSWYSVETLESTVAYSMPINEFKQQRVSHPEVKAIYYDHVEKRLLHYQKLFVSRIKDSPEKRYRELLTQHPEIIRRIPQHYIASFLGITSVSLSRIRNRK
ncbi:cyclic nucleotide-binding domain-containing protein [Spirosoma sp. HMF4905]|uniref:Cyclic nucleotide-binding domain-containing protein n=1 Tax=Spirosoma arboris TaxID=2682092 RepID=A0A7K1SQD0_9BACT|nr:Crp/Fnr family transcriptional regulator [Spirosoma arboris]MVM35987.1 cyclic nucleotide-binding domain-containing protein [Spirosoma arboris]